MNFLQINQSDISSGAAITGYRLDQGLLAQCIDSRQLVGKVQTSSDRVALIQHKDRIEKLLSNLNESLGLKVPDLVRRLVLATWLHQKMPMIFVMGLLSY